MNIALIDTSCQTINYGLRSVASYLKNNNHDIELIFLRQESINNKLDYPESIYNDLYSILKNVDFVGMSVVSNYIGQAQYITEFVKRELKLPVLWGGVHPTALPEECLENVDMICIGEGEEAFLELINCFEQGEIDYGINNIWFKQDNKIIKNELRNLEENLDIFPFPLMDINREYVRNGDRIERLTIDLFKSIFREEGSYFGMDKDEIVSYMTMTARGCPYSCTYCCNNLFKRIYKNKGKMLRYKSNERIIDELKDVLSKYPFIDIIQFYDDDFIAGREDKLSDFSKLYKAKIGLPFKINTSPSSISHRNIDILIDAGLIAIETGLQTASEHTNKNIYKRKFDKDQFIEIATILSEKPNLKVYYDIILDNPYETLKDVSTTLRFLAKLPMPYLLGCYSLTFFPGTVLHKRAVEDGTINNVESQVYDKTDNIIYYGTEPYIKFVLFILRLTKRNYFFPVPIIYSLTEINIMKTLNSKYLRFFWAKLLQLKIWVGMNIIRKYFNRKAVRSV